MVPERFKNTALNYTLLALLASILFSFPVTGCPDGMVDHTEVSQEVSTHRQDVQGKPY